MTHPPPTRTRATDSAAHVTSILAARPELMVRGVAGPGDLEALLDKASVVVVGPGLGQSAWSQTLLAAVTERGLPVVMAADAVVIAFGFNASPAPWFTEHGIAVDEWGLVKASGEDEFAFRTSNPKVFAAGDMVRGADLVVTAIADARAAAKGMLKSLGITAA